MKDSTGGAILKVSEMIEILQEADSDSEVYLDVHGEYLFTSSFNIYSDKDNDIVIAPL